MNKSFFILVLIRILINISDSLVYICSLWYISEKSPLLLSFAVVCFTMSENFLVFIGPIIDRYSPLKILLRAIVLEVASILLLGMLFHYGFLNDYFLLVLLVMFSFFSTITYPIEEKMIPMIVEKENLVQANSIVEIAYKIVDVLFNGLSGVLLSVFSIPFLYKVNLVFLIIPVILIKFWNYEQESDPEKEKYSFSQYKSDLVNGILFLKNKKMFRIIVPLVIANFFTAMTAVAMPLFARGFPDSEIVFGMFLAVAGAGGFIGAFLSNTFNKYLRVGEIITFGLVIQGFFYTLAIIFRGRYLMYVFLFVSYTFFGMTNIMYSTFFQSQTDIHYLGRVNTIIDSLITIAMPIGAITAGIIIERLHCPPYLIMLSYGLFCIAIGIIYFFDRKMYFFDLKSDTRKYVKE